MENGMRNLLEQIRLSLGGSIMAIVIASILGYPDAWSSWPLAIGGFVVAFIWLRHEAAKPPPTPQ